MTEDEGSNPAEHNCSAAQHTGSGGRYRGRAWKRLRIAAVLSLVIHACAGFLMLFVLRDGLDTNTDFLARVTFLVERKSEWILAWLAWNAAALSILYFYFSFVRLHHRWGGRQFNQRRFPPARISAMHYALALSTAAIALDLAAEAIQMGVLPDIAANYLAQERSSPAAASAKILFEAMNRTSIMFTGCFANFLYTATATILMFATRKCYGKVFLISGTLVAIAGVWLSIACVVNSVSGMLWSNAALLPALIIWQLTIALDAQKRERESGKPHATVPPDATVSD